MIEERTQSTNHRGKDTQRKGERECVCERTKEREREPSDNDNNSAK